MQSGGNGPRQSLRTRDIHQFWPEYGSTSIYTSSSFFLRFLNSNINYKNQYKNQNIGILDTKYTHGYLKSNSYLRNSINKSPLVVQMLVSIWFRWFNHVENSNIYLYIPSLQKSFDTLRIV